MAPGDMTNDGTNYVIVVGHLALNIDNTPDCLHWWPERGVQQPPDVTSSQHSVRV